MGQEYIFLISHFVVSEVLWSEIAVMLEESLFYEISIERVTKYTSDALKSDLCVH